MRLPVAADEPYVGLLTGGEAGSKVGFPRDRESPLR